MNIITALIVGFVLLLAWCFIYYFFSAHSLSHMKAKIIYDIKHISVNDIGDAIGLWIFLSVATFMLVNVIGLLFGLFDALNMNFFSMSLDFLWFDPMDIINISGLMHPTS